eukprot:4201551-Pyramimonas_sp.AAC.1
MVVTVASVTTAWPMAAPMLSSPADNDGDVLASATAILRGVRRARAADAREWQARRYLARIVPPSPARAQGRSDVFDRRREAPVRQNLISCASRMAASAFLCMTTDVAKP